MQKLWLILICMVVFPLSCSDVGPDDDPGADRGGFEEGDEGFSREEEGDSIGKGACKGDGYTLYLDDCEEVGESLTSEDTSTLSSQDFLEEGEGGATQPVDILFVLDTSASMRWWYRPYQFKKKFKYFFPSLKGVNWRMLFTTADFSSYKKTVGHAMAIEGKYGLLKQQDTKEKQRYIDYTVGYNSLHVNHALHFYYTMTTEPNRSHESQGKNDYGDGYVTRFPPYLGGTEYPLRALQHSFSANKSLTRENGALVAIIVSNADEDAHKKSPEPTPESIKEAFQKVYGDNKQLYVLNLIIRPGDQKCLSENNSRQFWFPESKEGQKIAKVAEEIGGGNFSICLPNYSIVAKTIVRLSKQ